MTAPRATSLLATRFASSWVTAVTIAFLLTGAGCTSEPRTANPSAPVTDGEVIGTLVAVKDDRPVDGGIDLTLQTAPGDSELVRVPSIFIVPPRDSIRAMHEVVDAAKIGDRLRARGTRDESGALRAETLELLPR